MAYGLMSDYRRSELETAVVKARLAAALKAVGEIKQGDDKILRRQRNENGAAAIGGGKDQISGYIYTGNKWTNVTLRWEPAERNPGENPTGTRIWIDASGFDREGTIRRFWETFDRLGEPGFAPDRSGLPPNFAILLAVLIIGIAGTMFLLIHYGPALWQSLNAS